MSLGAIPERCGNRNAPTAMYASFVPPFHYDKEREQYIGGLFWDGRAVTLEDQAKGPFLNRLEMNNRKAALIGTVERSTYADMFRQVYGADAFANVDKAFDHVADAIAAYEREIAAASPLWKTGDHPSSVRTCGRNIWGE